MLDFLNNTDIVVTIAFVVFVAFLIWQGVPKLIAKLLDKRADDIRAELEEAKRLREEAQEIFANYERQLQEVEVEAQSIVKQAEANAQAAATDAKAQLEKQMQRRLEQGKEQIASAEASVERQIRANAADIATRAAQAVMAEKLGGKSADDLINMAIDETEKAAVN